MDSNAVHRALTDDLEFFSEHANLVVKDVQGNLVPFRFKIAQRYTHDKLEEQRRKFGWVRALIVKGRQQGLSTYINARFFHQAMRFIGQTVFILSHESKTTDSLFAMVHRFYDNMAAALKPLLGKDNPRQMTFPGLNADYSAGTAGNEQVGRGGTAQKFHGSEAAYWKNAYAIQDGALKSIRLIAGTEVILESTANGPVGLFYDKCKQALAGIGDYILIFVPWYWEPDYEREVEPGFELTEKEEKYVLANFAKPFPYHDEPISRAVALRKMAWRRAEIIELSTGNNPESGEAKFRSIYPSNPVEAFLSTSVGLVRPDAITAARAAYETSEVDEVAARVAGVDPAGAGKKADRTTITIRQGRVVEKVLKFPKMKPMELAGIIAKLIADEQLDMVFVDRGYGEGTIDRLHELGYGRKVIGVSFSEKAMNPIYLNKRAEIIIEYAKWLNEGGVAIPDGPESRFGYGFVCGGDEIHADLAAMPLDKETSNGVKYIMPKEQIISEFGRSPDIFDSGALTFAYPVRRGSAHNTWKKAGGETATGGRARTGGLSSMARRRAMGRP